MSVEQGRFAQIDTLRAVAVLAVTASHTVDLDGPFDRYGAYGVRLFFVVSGFLITGLLMDARRRASDLDARFALRSFYARRALRVVPLYYLVLLVAFAIGVANVRHEIVWHALFMSNWYLVQHGAWTVATSHLWTLGVEEQFYLVWGLVVLLLPRRFLPWAIGAMLVSAPLVRLVLARHGFWTGESEIVTPASFDSLGLGCLLAYGWRRYADRPKTVDRLVQSTLLLVVALFTVERIAEASSGVSYSVEAITNIWWPLLCMWLVHKASRGVGGRVGVVLSWRPLIYLGVISYGIYVLHLFVMPVAEMIHRHVLAVPIPDHRGFVQFVFVAGISIAGAALSWAYLEKPINGLKSRFPYVRPARQAVADVDRSRPKALD